MKNRELSRMLHWLAIAAILHIMAIVLGATPYPQLSTVCWKLGNAAIAGYAGYWLDKGLFRDKLTIVSSPMIQMRRAVIVAAVVISVAMGM